ncbi:MULTISPECIES: hypothetical protein [unclassified Cedecea]|uniref:hypothetical protein n=1 Tax=unclassified Cedecea TaxID=2649846 RepID=UPI0002D559C0|nr:hypothetical protein [Enterobacter sp. Ag1]
MLCLLSRDMFSDSELPPRLELPPADAAEGIPGVQRRLGMRGTGAFLVAFALVGAGVNRNAVAFVFAVQFLAVQGLGEF